MKSILFYKSFNKQKYQIFSINTFSDECDLLIFSVWYCYKWFDLIILLKCINLAALQL